MKKKRIVFLYLNGLHHLYHTAMTAMEMGLLDKDIEVLCLSCNNEHTRVLTEIRARFSNTSTCIIPLKEPFRYRYLNYKKKNYPSVNAMMKKAKSILKDADVVVTTSHGTPRMFMKYKIIKPHIIYQYHGCGDRRYGFNPNFKNIDYMLLPGRYHQSRLMEEGIITRSNTAVVGWPKFDFVADIDHEFFDNGRPTVLYCPHWEPGLTSYNVFSEEILEYFSESSIYNLIFAPHILIKHWHKHYNYDITYERYAKDNIIIDYGSDHATNGAYLKYSDIYIGDVSSMVYEFIAGKPRPCLFLNAHKVKWKDNPDYRFWEYGPVLDNMNDFRKTLENSLLNPEFLLLQKKRILEYFDISEESSSRRAAEAINKYCRTLGKSPIARRRLK